jgi:hypothetical protein
MPGVLILFLSAILFGIAFLGGLPIGFSLILGILGIIFIGFQIRIWRMNHKNRKVLREIERRLGIW